MSAARSFGPRDLFDYIYAVPHSPAYRARYVDYLKSDFARIPLRATAQLFEALVPLGTELVALHLLDADALPALLKDPKGIRLAGSGEARVEQKPEFNAKLGRVSINSSRWFEVVPQVAWDFHIGGYQPAQKWLEDRAKGGKNAGPGRVLLRRRHPPLSSNDRRAHAHRRADAPDRRGDRNARRLARRVSRNDGRGDIIIRNGEMAETSEIASNFFGDELYQQRARVALPLIRQAEAGKTIYYADLAQELRMPNPRNLNFVLGCVGNALKDLSKSSGEEIPRIQAMVVNQHSETPGDGFDGFLRDRGDLEE